MSSTYGPNSVAAERLLDDLDHLDPGAIAALAAAGGGSTGTAGDDPDVAARVEARGRLREVAKRAARLGPVRAIGDEVAAWASSTSHWFPAGVAGGGESTAEIGPRMAAVPIVLDAAYAVVLEDLLEDDELDLLLGPWEQVVGSPFGERAPGDGDGDVMRGDESRADALDDGDWLAADDGDDDDGDGPG